MGQDRRGERLAGLSTGRQGRLARHISDATGRRVGRPPDRECRRATTTSRLVRRAAQHRPHPSELLLRGHQFLACRAALTAAQALVSNPGGGFVVSSFGASAARTCGTAAGEDAAHRAAQQVGPAV